jgi:hypothetical protein
MFDEEQMKEEYEGRKTKLDVGGTPLITANLCKTNVFLILNLTERTILTDKVVFKGSK